MKKLIVIAAILIGAAVSASAVEVNCRTLAFDKTVTLCESTMNGTTIYSRHESSAAGASIKTITQDEYIRILTEDSHAADIAAHAVQPQTTEEQKAVSAGQVIEPTPVIPQGPAPKATKESCKASGGKWSKGGCKGGR